MYLCLYKKRLRQNQPALNIMLETHDVNSNWQENFDEWQLYENERLKTSNTEELYVPGRKLGTCIRE